jgi:hypothetical protein
MTHPEDDVEPDGPITLKITGLPQWNEREYAQYQYDMALKRMEANPTEDNIKAFGEANCHLFEVEDAYRIGTRLRFEFVTKKRLNSQKSHLL